MTPDTPRAPDFEGAPDPEAEADDSAFEALLREAVHMPPVTPRRMHVRFGKETTLLGGRFAVRRFLGEGGMGVVYEVEDRVRNAPVALKTLPFMEAAGIYRLKQEFRALADVVHPHLVGLHELFFDGEQWFFTMDLVQGLALFEYLGETPDAARLKRVFAELALGIHAIHLAGKLHRDLKPTNVMVTRERRVMLMDFGLASDQELGGVGQTVADESVSGTPLYMAPEQAASRPASRMSDWYAFGVMLFEALTGKAPFRGSGNGVLVRKQKEEAPLPSSLRENIPEDLEKLCAGLLSRTPGARPGFEAVMGVLGCGAGTRSEAPVRPEKPLFVGRERELAALKAAFEATEQGRPVAVFVQGPSGMGKSALVERFLGRLEERGRAVVLTGRCYERESVPQVTAYHDRIRETVAGGMAAEVLNGWHARWAAVIEGSAAPDVEALCRHYLCAGNRSKALIYTERAADQAMTTLAFEHAASLYEQALGLLPANDPRKGELCAKLGQSLADAGRSREASRAFVEAAHCHTDPEQTDLKWRAAEQALMGGDFATGLPLLEEVLPRFGLKLPISKVQNATMISKPRSMRPSVSPEASGTRQYWPTRSTSPRRCGSSWEGRSPRQRYVTRPRA